MGRYFIRFRRQDERSLVAEAFAPTAGIGNEPYASRHDPLLLIADLGPDEVRAARDTGAEVFEDAHFRPVSGNPVLPPGLSEEWEYWERTAASMQTLMEDLGTQADVMSHVRATDAWRTTRGEGVTIAIVDTGIAGTHPEFPQARRSPHSLGPSFDDPWSDGLGHGSMCACAAAGSDEAGGRYNGVAPGATLLAARTTLFASDIYKIYDTLIDRYVDGAFGGPLVISNSYGLYSCSAPDLLPEDHPYLALVREAVDAGITVVFAAGNNHAGVLCQHDPAADEPNTIWGVNSIDEVITVGTVNRFNSNQHDDVHANSSRGPGQWSTRVKPDLVAPTYGDIAWADGYRALEWWGTSGACPQVAGAAALVLAANPGLTPAEVGAILRETAVELPAPRTCVGAGLLDCEAAVRAGAQRR